MKKWSIADLHIHSTFSDGTVPVEEIVKIYREAGFDVTAITDISLMVFRRSNPEGGEEFELERLERSGETSLTKML